MITATVDTTQLRQALQAVIPHTDSKTPELAGIRCTVTDTQMILAATNRYTAALARADVLDVMGLSGSLVDDSFQLPVAAARELLALFKVPREPKQVPVVAFEVEPTGKLHTSRGPDHFDHLRKGIEQKAAPQWDGEKVREARPASEETVQDPEPQSPAKLRVVDVTGLWPGKRYEVPADPHAPVLARIPLIVSGVLTEKAVMPAVMSMSGTLLKLFAAATTAYNDRLVLQATGRKQMLMCTVSESFVGMLMPAPVEPDSEDAVRVKGWHADWDDILTGLS